MRLKSFAESSSHLVIRKSKSLPEEDDDIITVSKPKKLDAAFAEISNSPG